MTVRFPQAPKGIPSVTADETRRLEYWCTHEFQLTPNQLWELQAERACELARRRFDLEVGDAVAVACGMGGHAGVGLTLARHLVHWGHDVTIVLTEPSTKLAQEARRALAAARKEGASAPNPSSGTKIPEAELIIDAVMGIGLKDSLREAERRLIGAVNAHDAPAFALDVPSGLDSDTGAKGEASVEAEVTLAFALPKTGTLEKTARPFVGELYLADSGLPRSLYDDWDLEPEVIFADGPILRLS